MQKLTQTCVRWAPEASYVLGSVRECTNINAIQKNRNALVSGRHASLLRHGVDSPENLRFLISMSIRLSSPKIHFMYNEIANQIPTIGPYASFRDVLSAVGDIYDRYIMGSFD